MPQFLLGVERIVGAKIWVRTTQLITSSESLLKKINLNDGSRIEYYENVQIRKNKENQIITQYLQTTTGRIIFNYTMQKTLDFFEIC